MQLLKDSLRLRSSYSIASLLMLGLLFLPFGAKAQDINLSGEPDERPSKLFRQAEEAEEAKRFGEAEAIWRELLQINSLDSSVHYGLCRVLNIQNKLDEAENACRRSVQLSPNDPESSLLFGIVLRKQRKLDEAISAFQTAANQYRKVTEYAPQNANAYAQLGSILQEQGELDEAIANYRKAIERNSQNSSFYFLLGLALAEQRKFNEATSALRQALRLPNMTGKSFNIHAEVHNLLGALSLDSGKLEDAIAEFDKAIALDPKDDRPKINLVEAERLLALRRNPQSGFIKDDYRSLPSATEFPLVHAFRSTVRILTKGIKGMETGTGWVVKREGDTLWIVTNRHVVSNGETPSSNISLEFYSRVPANQRFHYKATIEHMTPPMQDPDKDLDLAVLKVVGVPSDIKPLELFDGNINPATSIRVIGHPSGRAWSVVKGDVMNVMPDQPKFSLDVTVAEGNSGSPVINEKGQVVGMIVIMQTEGDLAFNPDEPADQSPQLATGGIAPAYQIDTIVKQLRDWRILN